MYHFKLHKILPRISHLFIIFSQSYNFALNFTDQASIEDFKAAGYGETKKAAKSNAATNLLKTLGIDLEELRKAKGVQEKKVLFFREVYLFAAGNIILYEKTLYTTIRKLPLYGNCFVFHLGI